MVFNGHGLSSQDVSAMSIQSLNRLGEKDIGYKKQRNRPIEWGGWGRRAAPAAEAGEAGKACEGGHERLPSVRIKAEVAA